MTRISVVTGASGGIGRAIARKLGERGDAVALLARGEDGLEGAAEDIRRAGGTPLPIEVDMADFAAVDAAAERVEKELGSIDLWVNDAFSSVFAPFTEIDMDEFTRVTQVSYLGYVYGTKAALTRMLPRDRGTVVQVGSALAYRGIPLQSAYCGAKHAIQGFNESLRVELLHVKSNVHVTMVQMPAVNTPQFGWVLSRLPQKAQPVPPIYQPEVAAKAVLYAAPRLGQPVEPVASRRRRARPGRGCARRLRRPGQDPQSAALGVTAPRSAGSGRRRRPRGGRGVGATPQLAQSVVSGGRRAIGGIRPHRVLNSENGPLGRDPSAP
jgi:NAD(P)-dependent dehydrogenase (short-subunit alcohol dehydrogenase family)